MQLCEGEGRTEMEYTEIEIAAEAFDRSLIFHVVNEIVGFVLYMHQQIPAILQDLRLEFDTLQLERKDLDSVVEKTELKASSRRKHNGRMREVKQGIKKLEKLMSTITSLQTALKLMLENIPDIHGIILVLGASPRQPQHIYELFFSHGRAVPKGVNDFTKSKAAEGLSRKLIRTLISKGAGSCSYAGPTKLFLLVNAPASFNLPLHFLPKREFRYSKKIVPSRLLIKCRMKEKDLDVSHNNSPTVSSISFPDSTPSDLIWFQCRHSVKGLPSNTPLTEE